MPKKPKKKHDLRVSFTKKQADAWKEIMPILKSMLSIDGVPGGAIAAFRSIKDQSRKSTIRSKAKVFSEVLEMIGE